VTQVGLGAAVVFKASRDLQEDFREVALRRSEAFGRVERGEVFGLRVLGGRFVRGR